MLLTDRARLPDPVAAVALLPRGSLVILRDGDLPAGARLALGLALASVCRRRGLRLLVAGDPTLARQLRAGVHWPEKRLPPRVRGFATAAAHGMAALIRARRAGVSAVLLSPVLPTASHPGAPHLGIVRFAGLVRRVPGLAVYALGGIDGTTVGRLAGSGAAGIAAIGAFRP